MTIEELDEARAKAAADADGYRGESETAIYKGIFGLYLKIARAIRLADEARCPGITQAMLDVMEGKAVVMPREPDDAQIEAGEEEISQKKAMGLRVYASDIYHAMCAAFALHEGEGEADGKKEAGVFIEGFTGALEKLCGAPVPGKTCAMCAASPYTKESPDEAV